MTRLRWLGIAVALAGAAIVISHGNLPSLLVGALGPGEAFLIGSVLGWAVYTLIGRRVLGRVSALATTTYAAIIGTAMLAVGALVEQPWGELAALPAKGWAAIAYLGVLGTVVAFLWFYEGVQRIGASRTAVFINLVPVFGVAIGAFVLGESVPASLVLGGLMVIAGVTLANQPTRRPHSSR
jgi:drug/metabolite transporter (DMT)-like permease